ncbi:putative mitochondrial carrier protein [Trypanosoma theileri]|uniref:Putative mitochondrial carrier protein n=1 Tax=Trypanosoma theileri TaxID=67003 RepID=A0A1X0NLW7_9TRYP|nr:putative mitochondrial carrier protein [Trypanosoma theileri]ORC85528.1 putative mitochondrial carrier protein [Trypanosoma theileri]
MSKEFKNAPIDGSEERKKVLRRFVGGTVGGMFQALCSHPFDTVKSRVQSGMFPGVVSCFHSTWRSEGIRGFYRGLTPPLMMGGIYNSILFSVNQFMMNLLTPEGEDDKAKAPFWRAALSGELTAPIYVLCITPMEKVKVKLQLRKGNTDNTKFTGPISCIRYIVKTEGLSGMFSGYVPTLFSRLAGLPFYFGGYQMAYHSLSDSSIGTTTVGKNLAIPMMSGCVAGTLFWLSNYPFDYVKTQVQAGEGQQRMSQVFITTYKKGGIRAFYKGLSACLLRAIPANASVWLGIEWVTRVMERNGF